MILQRNCIAQTTADEASVNMAYRWFLGYGLNETTPRFSTVSYNFRHRFTAETIDKIFNWILDEIAQAGYLKPEAVFIDGTHIKANANTKKQIKEEVPVAAKRYADELIKSNPEICKNCPARELCTKSKDCVKVVTRHIWKDYEELAEDVRHTPKYKKLYRMRKEKIERVFADAKEKHAMRYTPYTGLAQVSNWVRLKFVAMNLKKFAKWKWNSRKNHLHTFIYMVNTKFFQRNPCFA